MRVVIDTNCFLAIIPKISPYRSDVGVDVEMHPTRQGIQEGRDELLEKAVKLIREGK